MNWKGFGRKLLAPNRGIFPEFSVRDWGNWWTSPFSIASVPSTEYYAYQHDNPLCLLVVMAGVDGRSCTVPVATVSKCVHSLHSSTHIECVPVRDRFCIASFCHLRIIRDCCQSIRSYVHFFSTCYSTFYMRTGRAGSTERQMISCEMISRSKKQKTLPHIIKDIEKLDFNKGTNWKWWKTWLPIK